MLNSINVIKILDIQISNKKYLTCEHMFAIIIIELFKKCINCNYS